MKTIEEIKNNYAKERGYLSWKSLLSTLSFDIDFICKHENKVFELVQIEQQKLIADNADTKMERYNDLQDVIVVDKDSIINENNIIR